jgi:hypothetical protein
MLAAGMPSLENHEGWGNRFVVLHETAKLGHPQKVGQPAIWSKVNRTTPSA